MPKPRSAATGVRVLAIASGGGHWQQLMLMRPAFADQDVTYATTLPGLPEAFGVSPATILPDCNRNEKMKMLRAFLATLRLMRQVRPHVVVSTGALPGVIALALGKMRGSRTIWVDSVANAEEMSMSGRLARRFSDLWLSQWEHVAESEGAEYAGRIL